MEAVDFRNAGKSNVDCSCPLMRPAQIKNPKRIAFRWIAEKGADSITQLIRDSIGGQVVKLSPLALSPEDQAVNISHGGNPRAR